MDDNNMNNNQDKVNNRPDNRDQGDKPMDDQRNNTNGQDTGADEMDEE